jgi:hypothetical protein
VEEVGVRERERKMDIRYRDLVTAGIGSWGGRYKRKLVMTRRGG